MKRASIFLFWISIFMFFSPRLSNAQSTDGGIRVKENKGKTIVYEIKIIGVDDAALAQYLDQKMKGQAGVISSTTNSATGICTVECNATLTTETLKKAISSGGFEVAKGF